MKMETTAITQFVGHWFLDMENREICKSYDYVRMDCETLDLDKLEEMKLSEAASYLQECFNIEKHFPDVDISEETIYIMIPYKSSETEFLFENFLMVLDNLLPQIIIEPKELKGYDFYALPEQLNAQLVGPYGHLLNLINFKTKFKAIQISFVAENEAIGYKLVERTE